jgi:ribosomal protein S18
VDDLGRRVRMAKMALNVLGRSVKSQEAKTVLDDGAEFGRDTETGFTQHLSKSEFETFQKYMRDQHDIQVTEDDVPVHDDASMSMDRNSKFGALDDDELQIQGITDDSLDDPDNPDLSLKWLTSRARWNVSKKYGAEHPFEDMLPRDLNLSRIVNRKRAKPLPRELLHHNNLSLLRRYISPAGQIMHRVRTRLGARDQRKVSKLIKRARKLGMSLKGVRAP